MTKNSNNLNKSDFDWYIEELYKVKQDNPNKANSIARRGLDELGLLNKSSGSNSLGIDYYIAAMVGICLLIAACILLVPNTQSMPLYLGGIVFFFAGIFIGLYVPVFGLVFLFTHGAAGLILILMSLLGGTDNNEFNFDKIFNNPAFSDGGMPGGLKLYLWAIATVLVTTLIYTILHNLSPRLKENKIHAIIILLLYLIAIILVGLLSRFFPVLLFN